ncbi:GDP-L-fucose synthase [Pelomyxa schiedti]|nr:GDP-L-fucose synthase [Pelomyxa schiedti]
MSCCDPSVGSTDSTASSTTTTSAPTPTPASTGDVVLVTGGTGLVGCAIEAFVNSTQATETLRAMRWVFTGVEEFDLRDPRQCRLLFERVRPTHVIHLAARVGGLFANLKFKVEFYRENILINDNVMECCKDFHVKKLISFLSTCIFPDKTTYPIDESMLHNGAPHESNEGYAYAKRMIDVLNRCYNSEYGCHFTSIIPTNIFGPHDNYSLESGHVVPALIHKCYIAKRDSKPFVVLGTGKPLRQFIYSRDLAELVCWVLLNYDSVEPIILSVDPEAEVSIGQVATMIAEAFDYTHALTFNTEAADGQYRKTASNSKLRALLPDFQFTPIKQAIQESVTWFVENYDKSRK